MGSMALPNLNVQSDGSRVDRHGVSTAGVAGTYSGGLSYNDMLSSFMNDGGEKQSDNKGRNNKSAAGSSSNQQTSGNNDSMSMLNALSFKSLPIMNYTFGGQTATKVSGGSQSNQQGDDQEGNMLMGDLDGNGVVDETDTQLAVKCHFGETKGIKWQAADFDGDGEITAADLADVMNTKNKDLAPQYKKEIRMGDINEDGVVDEKDKELLTRYALGDENNIKWRLGDFSGDGKITSEDLSDMITIVNEEKNKLSKLVYKEDNIAENFDKVNNKANDNIEEHKIISGSPIKYQSGGWFGLDVRVQGAYLTMYDWSRNKPTIDYKFEARRLQNGDVKLKYYGYEAILDKSVTSILTAEYDVSIEVLIRNTIEKDAKKNEPAYSGGFEKFSTDVRRLEKYETGYGAIFRNCNNELKENNRLNLYGWDFNGNAEIFGVDLDSHKSKLNMYSPKEIVINSDNKEYALIEGAAYVEIEYGKMKIETRTSTKVNTKEDNITLNVNGYDNHVLLEGENNSVILNSNDNIINIKGRNAIIDMGGDNNHINVNNVDALIKCGEGHDNISVNSIRTYIYNFNPSFDTISLGNFNKQLEVKQLKNHIMVKGVDDNPNDFILAFIGSSDVDMVQNLVDKHNREILVNNLRKSYSEQEDLLSEKIGKLIQKEISPQFNSTSVKKVLDDIGQISVIRYGKKVTVPNEVKEAYNEYIMKALYTTAVEAADVTNSSKLVSKLQGLFSPKLNLEIGDYRVEHVMGVSWADTGAFVADVYQGNRLLATMSIVNYDENKILEAQRTLIDEGRKLHNSALNQAIEAYTDELGEYMGLNLTNAYNIGKGMIDYLYGGDIGKSNFFKMIRKLGRNKTMDVLRKTFGNDVVDAIEGLQKAKNIIEELNGLSNANDYEKPVSLLEKSAKYIDNIKLI